LTTNKNHIESYTYIKSGFTGVSNAAYNKYERLEIDGGFDALEEGYLYIYVANETALDQEVYFDDIKVTHESALANFKVSQVNEYYPYGLPTANSWRNKGYIDQGLLYQSSFASYDSLTGYYDFLSRSYDPATGRFFAVDPAGQFSSPYVGMGNLPHWGVDPNGETFLGAIKAIGGFLWGGLKNGFRQSAFSTGVNYATGGSGFTVGFSNNIPYGGGPGVGLGTNRDYGLNFSYSTYGFNGGPLNGTFGGVSGMGWGVPDSQGTQTYPTVANAAEQGGMVYMDGRIRDYSAEWGAGIKTLQMINEWNPIAIGANSFSAFRIGYDMTGNRVNGGQATFNLATALPFFRSAKYLNGGIKWIGGAFKGSAQGFAKNIGNLNVPVYRVYGGGASMYGKSYSIFNPKYVPGYRNFAGLPKQNSGQFLLKGNVQLRNIQLGKPFASPIIQPGYIKTGGVPAELYINFNKLQYPRNLFIRRPF